MNSTPTPEAIAHAHRRAYRLTSGAKTYAQHVETCASCTAAKAAK